MIDPLYPHKLGRNNMAAMIMYSQSDNRAEVSRLGHKRISTKVQGWNIGVSVQAIKNDEGKIEIAIYKTGGSNGAKPSEYITTIKE